MPIRLIAGICAGVLLFVVTRATALDAPLRIGVGEGAVYDAILDGFPGIAAFDGLPDLGGNALGVALKLMVTEERGIAEFPLASLASVSADTVSSATVTFNIDDVLSTFGPGTDFAGRAGHEIILYVYSGDGTIDLDDFTRITNTGHRVNTSIHGTITDATLRTSGPLLFEVDITDDFRAVLDSGASHVGIVWRTTDSPTGTSLDDLGDGSSGPPGVGGAQLPYLTVEVHAAATPTPTTTAPTNVPTPIPTGGATVSPTPASAVCAGDCGNDGTVTVEELLVLVNVALGTAELSRCVAGDADGDAEITVNEVVVAVSHLLTGCPADRRGRIR